MKEIYRYHGAPIWDINSCRNVLRIWRSRLGSTLFFSMPVFRRPHVQTEECVDSNDPCPYCGNPPRHRCELCGVIVCDTCIGRCIYCTRAFCPWHELPRHHNCRPVQSDREPCDTCTNALRRRALPELHQLFCARGGCGGMWMGHDASILRAWNLALPSLSKCGKTAVPHCRHLEFRK